MIHLDKDMLRGLQLTEVELLQEVDRICAKRGIPYCIIAGTLLGAKRHGGFIPRDDDADVALLRQDYERFVEACAEELDTERFYFQDHNVTPGYRWGYGKLRRKDTLFLREYQEHMPYEQGVFIDVFPLDSVPESKVARTLWNFLCFCVRKALWSPVGAVVSRTGFMRSWYKLLSMIPEDRVKGALNGLIRKAAGFKSRWVRILMFPTPNEEYGYLREWYATQEPAVFENVEFQGVHDPDAYLTFKFGDWHELPPEDKRKTHPVSAFKLVGQAAPMESERYILKTRFKQAAPSDDGAPEDMA
ncbi:MAG: LicD family protein [Atopobiaceae bacterium]|nr:LicD family protein [Atopobiaceae bacterium]